MKSSQVKDYPLHDYYSMIYKKYDLVNRLFTLGNDMKWRRITAFKCLEFKPVTIIDLCCGTGDLTLLIRKLSKEIVTVTGFDFNAHMLTKAKTKAEKLAYPDIDFIQGDVVSMPFHDAAFDCMTIGFGFRNLTFNNTRIKEHMSEIYRIIKPGGHLLILESSVPSLRIVRFFYKLYLKLVLIPLGGFISGSWNAYSYLATSSANYYSVTEIEELLKRSRFKVESATSFFPGVSNLIVARKD